MRVVMGPGQCLPLKIWADDIEPGAMEQAQHLTPRITLR
jgi:hypothetical protein